jgi:hypothetical protein
MSSERRLHRTGALVRRYREAARAGLWDIAKFHAIILRKRADTNEAIAACLYAEGYAREHLGDLRLAAACYEMAWSLTAHQKARRRLTHVAHDAVPLRD